MANSRAQNLVQNRQRYNKSHETKHGGRPDQDKEKNELPRLVLIMECSTERCGRAHVFCLGQGNITGCCKGGYEMTFTVCVRKDTQVGDALRATLQAKLCWQLFCPSAEVMSLQMSRGSNKKRGCHQQDMRWTCLGEMAG